MREPFGVRPLVFGIVAALLIVSSARAQVKDWPSERPPRPLAARDVKFPPYEIRTLKNGLQVIAVLHHEQPAVSLRLIVRGGGAQDPAGRPGTAKLLSALLDQGTATRSAEQIANTIDSVGGALGTGSGSDLTFINAVFMTDSFDLGLQLVSDLARNPALAPAEIERQRKQMLSSLRVSADDPEYIANVVFDRLIYGFHPYGQPDAGTPDSLVKITREDLVAFHRAYFAPNNAILAIVGDVSAEQAFAGAEKAFGDWPPNDAVRVTTPAEPPPATRRVIVVDRPGAVQTEIRVGNVTLPRKHPDYMALDLTSRILGGEGANRLHRVLRSERGLTYGASADLDTFKFSGDLMASTNTRSATTAEALRLIVDEFWKLQRERVGDSELEGAQDYMTGSFPLTIETPSAIALRVLNALFFGLDLNELQTYRDRVNAVTVDDVQRAARLYLKPDRLSIVLVGDAASFVPQLSAAGFPQYERIPIAELDLTTADLRKHGAGALGDRPGAYSGIGRVPRARTAAFANAAAVQSAAGASRADDVLARALAAKGGEARLKQIRTVQGTATMRVSSGATASDVAVTTWIEYPDKFRVDIESPGGRIEQVLASGQSWFRDPKSGTTMTGNPAELKASVDRDVLTVLLRSAAGSVAVRPARRETLDGRAVDALDCALATGPVRLLIDPVNGLVLGERYAVHLPGGMVDAEERYSDYRDVDGVMVPFTTTLRRGGSVVAERKLKTVRFNVSIPPETFVKPQPASNK